ncbi:MAG TPA: EAL domain-containing protein, partial [Gammaproteobacteria bacterium]|nr:EAL domain-containing protein [Gammaproteobacteria bacterium]
EMQTLKMTDIWRLKSGNIYELHMEPQYLQKKIIGFVLSCRDVTHSKKMEEQLLYQSTHDSLTELPNRILLKNRIAENIQEADQKNTHLAVLLIDLDNFKEINDKFGHDTGDELLKQIGARLNQTTNETDTVVRLGGDEFVVLLASQLRAEDAIVKAKEFLQKFAVPFQIDHHTLVITVSIGISYYPNDGEDANTLLKCADAALYHAKKLGKNTFQVFMSEYNQQLLRRAELNAALIQALGKNQFILNYQPLYDIHSNKIIGFEILLRWQHPTLGIIFPEKFITLAEETGLIAPIGEWVINEACKQIKIWQEKFDPHLIIAVNISEYQFMQKNFLKIVKSALEQAQITPNTLELELMESIVYAANNVSAKILEQLKKMGVRLSIDDFGMGNLNFAYLKNLSFDKIKIDKSLIKGVTNNKYDEAVVEAIIQMMNKLNIETLAEGVENEAQLNFLIKHHVKQVQGYFYSSPVDINVCEDLLEKQKSINEEI